MIRIVNEYDCSKGNRGSLNALRGSVGLRRMSLEVVWRAYRLLRTSMPSAIEIETINRCNNECAFCPVNRHKDPRRPARMSDELLEKIARELHERQYKGLLALFSNNEPLMDKRIVDICWLFRNEVPHAYIYISTNGILLTSEIYTRLFDAGLDQMTINNYDDGLELIGPVKAMAGFMNSARDSRIAGYVKKTKIVMRKKNEILSNRAGCAPNKDENFDRSYTRYSSSSCTLPFIQVVIRPSGQVSLCCQDALGMVTLGNVNNQSIRGIWNSQEFNDVRNRLSKYGRKAVPLCSVCDVALLCKAVTERRLYGFIGFGMSRFEI